MRSTRKTREATTEAQRQREEDEDGARDAGITRNARKLDRPALTASPLTHLRGVERHALYQVETQMILVDAIHRESLTTHQVGLLAGHNSSLGDGKADLAQLSAEVRTAMAPLHGRRACKSAQDMERTVPSAGGESNLDAQLDIHSTAALSATDEVIALMRKSEASDQRRADEQ